MAPGSTRSRAALTVTRARPAIPVRAGRRRGRPPCHTDSKRKGWPLMADALPESTLAALDDPFRQLSGPLASTTRLDLQVVESARLTPHMQRLRLTAPQLDGFGYLPGQDVMLLVAARGNRPVRRRYTIRTLDAAARLPP